ncbi:MAG: hypothetical protein JWR83_3302 [Aeromicrobium sp.]|nr:hypothetical protein [Aeromicrobium sp.]
MTAAKLQRPPLLVAVCAYIGVVCAIQCLTAASAVSAWTSIDGQTSRKPLIDALVRGGLSRGTAESGYRTFLIVEAGVAAMCVVLAVYTAKSHRVSRTVLTVLAVVVAVFGATGPFLSQVQAIFLLVCVAQLWTADIRRYFRGEEPVVRAPRPAPVAAVPPPPVQPLQSGVPAPFPTGTLAAARKALPQPLTIAAWIGLIGSLIVTGFCAVELAVLLFLRDDYRRAIRDSKFMTNMLRQSGTDVDTIIRLSTIASAVVIVLGIVGVLASIALLTGRREGGVALLVMAAISCVVSILGFPFGVPWTVAAIVVIVQLRKTESRAWINKT